MQNSWVGVFFAYPFMKISRSVTLFYIPPMLLAVPLIYTLLYMVLYLQNCKSFRRKNRIFHVIQLKC